jgi:hypothetical protein
MQKEGVGGTQTLGGDALDRDRKKLKNYLFYNVGRR